MTLLWIILGIGLLLALLVALMFVHHAGWCQGFEAAEDIHRRKAARK